MQRKKNVYSVTFVYREIRERQKAIAALMAVSMLISHTTQAYKGYSATRKIYGKTKTTQTTHRLEWS